MYFFCRAPESDLVENYCRNANNTETTAFCYTQHGVGWDYCDIPLCPDYQRKFNSGRSNSLSVIWSVVPCAPLGFFFKFVHCSDGAVAPKGSMTYGTTHFTQKIRV